MSERITQSTFHGLPASRLDAPGGGQATVTDFGAHVVSWSPAPGDERLYMSEQAVFDGTKPLRGGVPVIFPQFGAFGSGVRHGFARLLTWNRTEHRSGPDFSTATWTMAPTDPAQHVPAVVEMTVCVEAGRLDLELHVAHTGGEAFEFTAALHTYLRVPDITSTTLVGLQNYSYMDQCDGGAVREQTERHLRIDREVDRIYRDAPGRLDVVSRDFTTRVIQDGFTDTVVWNPWVERSKAFADLPAEGFRRFVCVEAASVLTPVRLEPGQEWAGRQTLAAV